MVKYLYSIIVLFIARRASLGRGPPEVKPSTSEPLPARLRELAGKLGWMNWEPNLAEDAPLSEVRRSRILSEALKSARRRESKRGERGMKGRRGKKDRREVKGREFLRRFSV